MRRIYLQHRDVDTVAKPPIEWSDTELAIVVTPHIALATDMDGVYLYVFDRQIGDEVCLNSDDAHLVTLDAQGIDFSKLELETVAELFSDLARFIEH